MLVLSLVLLNALAMADPITVYTYDAITAHGGLAPALEQSFEKKTGSKVKFVGFPSAGEALNQIALEGAHTHADVLLGVDGGLLARAIALKAFLPAEKTTCDLVPADLRFDESRTFVPFDYGYLSFVYDSTRTKVPDSISFRDFVESSTRKRLVIEDPRTSSLGLAFLLWTKAIAGEDLGKIWDKLAPQIVTVAPGWSGAYALFLKKEAELVVSYTTSPAYHVEKEKKAQFRAIAFSDGNYRQIEAAAVVKASKQPDAARKFVAFLLSPEAQALVPATQWMYPVRAGTKLPASFDGLAHVKRAISLEPSKVQSHSAEWLREWTRRMAKSR